MTCENCKRLELKLAKAQAKIVNFLEMLDLEETHEAVKKALDQTDTTALDAAIDKAKDAGFEECRELWRKNVIFIKKQYRAAIAAAQQPLMDALKRMPEVAYNAIIEGAGVSVENLPNELQCICDNVLAKVKEVAKPTGEWTMEYVTTKPLVECLNHLIHSNHGFAPDGCHGCAQAKRLSKVKAVR